MADTVLIDPLAVLQDFAEGTFDLVPNRMEGCVAQIGVSTEALAAAIAEQLGIVGRVVSPSEFRAALFAIKRDRNLDRHELAPGNPGAGIAIGRAKDARQRPAAHDNVGTMKRKKTPSTRTHSGKIELRPDGWDY